MPGTDDLSKTLETYGRAKLRRAVNELAQQELPSSSLDLSGLEADIIDATRRLLITGEVSSDSVLMCIAYFDGATQADLADSFSIAEGTVRKRIKGFLEAVVREINEPGETGAGGDTDAWTWRDDHEAYERERDSLGREYPGCYIAMHRGEVIGVGDSANEAAREGLEQLDRPTSLFVIRAGDPLPEPEQLGMQMEAPRSMVCEQ
ncbi:MAG: hypothetical protein U9R79_19120 [Armatimonadota bacterium]|nr:hypothetical protein [Armatimonadota bacterium]